MKFTREQPEGQYTIHACRPGTVTLNSPNPQDGRDEEGRITLQRSFILTPDTLLRDWPPAAGTELQAEHLEPLRALQAEVLLLGTGERLQFPGGEQLALLVGLGMGYEVMDSAAACRTYNILAGEGRQVAAAIIIEG
jgi:uncharacterized protein